MAVAEHVTACETHVWVRHLIHHVVAAGGLPPLRIFMVFLGVHGRRLPTGCDDMV